MSKGLEKLKSILQISDLKISIAKDTLSISNPFGILTSP
jgi:hypothetical protein